ncbi:hypothetical protein ACIPIA_15600, partial [Bosea sp. CER48]
AELPRRRIAVILGSGLLRDIPLGLLAANFDRVLLVDAVHLPQVRLRMRLRQNVVMLTRDLTGAAGWLAGKDQGRADPLADLVADPTVDLVVSANLLSRLARPIEDWLADHPADGAGLPSNLPARYVALASRRSPPLQGPRDPAERCRDDRARPFLRRHRQPRSHARRSIAEARRRLGLARRPFGEAERDRESIHRVRAWREFR